MGVVIEAADLLEMLARARHDDGEPGAAPGIDFAADAVVVAMGLPVKREQTVRVAQRELRRAQRDMILAAGLGRPGDVAMGENHRCVGRQEGAGTAHHRILAGARRAHDIDEGARHQTTRWPSRHTDLTTGASSSMRTRTRSARRPDAISPRSLRPTARAGLSE